MKDEVKWQQQLKNVLVQAPLLGEFGLEKECHRIDNNGAMAMTKHPFSEKMFGRDFAESQLEMITPVCFSTEELYKTLQEMEQNAKKQLAVLGEDLWNYSNPPYRSGKVAVAQFEGNSQWKTQYRNHLLEKYGYEKMLYSGIHYNFSFPEKVFSNSAMQNNCYLHLAKWLYYLSFLPVALFAASPVYDKSLYHMGDKGYVVSEFASMRCSKEGYWNKEFLALDFSSVENYVAKIEEHIQKKKVTLPSEVYVPVRLKASLGKSFSSLLEQGIGYVEFRMIDLNPLADIGIRKEDLEWMQLLMVFCALRPIDVMVTEEEQSIALEKIKLAAKQDIPEDIRKEVLFWLDEMEQTMSDWYPNANKLIEYQREKMLFPEKRYANQVIQKMMQE